MYVYENTIPRHASTYDDDFATRAFARVCVCVSLSLSFSSFFHTASLFFPKMLSSFFFWINRKDFETLGEDFRKAIALHILKRDVLLARATTTHPEKGLKNRASFFLSLSRDRKKTL